jgi:hypothetical protein
MGIDKAGHDDLPGHVDFEGPTRQSQILYPAAGTHFNHKAVANENCAIMDYIELP